MAIPVILIGWNPDVALRPAHAEGLVVNTNRDHIICTPDDAYRCFMASDMDVLVLENCVLRRTEQPQQNESVRKKCIESFKLD